MYHDRSPWVPSHGQEGITNPGHPSWSLNIVYHGQTWFAGRTDARVLFIVGFHVIYPLYFANLKITNYLSGENCSDLNLDDFAYKSIIYHAPDYVLNRPFTMY